MVRIVVVSVHARVARHVLRLLALLLPSAPEHLVKEAELRRCRREERAQEEQECAEKTHFELVKLRGFVMGWLMNVDCSIVKSTIVIRR